MATGGLEPGSSRPKVLGFTAAPVRSIERSYVSSNCLIPQCPNLHSLTTCARRRSTSEDRWQRLLLSHMASTATSYVPASFCIAVAGAGSAAGL